MITARGRTRWSDHEKERALNLSENPDYQHKRGSYRGTPNYRLIARQLNIEEHDDKEIRYSNSVASLIRDTRRKVE